MVCRSVDIGGAHAIVCTHGRRRAVACSVSSCHEHSTRLCDYRLETGDTCDKPICSRHAMAVGRDIDFCPDHPHGR